MQRVFVTAHARERFQIHHPEADLNTFCVALDQGEEISTSVARFLVGRAADPTKEMGVSRYFLAPDRWGLFVLVEYDQPSHFPLTCVTYLRFQHSQFEFVKERWPPKPATAFSEKPEPKPDMHPELGCPLDQINVLPCLREVFGGAKKARRALLESLRLGEANGNMLYVHPSGVHMALRPEDMGGSAGLMDDALNEIDVISRSA